MANFDRLPTRVEISPQASLRRLSSTALDAPQRRNSRAITATASFAPEDDDLYVDSTAGVVTVTLPASGVMIDRTISVTRWLGGNTVTVECAAGDTLAMGGTSVALSAIGDAAELKSVTLPSGTSAWMRQNTPAAGGPGGAPTGASYIVQTPDATLTSEQALSVLTTGLVLVTTGTGVLSTATADIDYASAVHASRHKDGGVDVLSLHELADPAASVEFAQQQALQFVIENRTSDPGSPVAGQIWLRTDL